MLFGWHIGTFSTMSFVKMAGDLLYELLEFIVCCIDMFMWKLRWKWWYRNPPCFPASSWTKSMATSCAGSWVSTHCHGIHGADECLFHASHAGIGVVIGLRPWLLWFHFPSFSTLSNEGKVFESWAFLFRSNVGLVHVTLSTSKLALCRLFFLICESRN